MACRAQHSRRPSSPRRIVVAVEKAARAQRLSSSRRPSTRSPWREAARRAARAGRGAAARGHAARHQGSVLHRGRRPTAGSSILEGFKPPYESRVTANLLRGGRGDARQAQHGRVRHGLVQRDQRLRPGDQPVAAQRRRQCGADPGRLARAARRRRSRRGSRRASPAPTPAARSASRRPSPASPGSSRPTAAARAGASSPSPRRSTRPGRWRATCATARSCWRPMAGFDPKDSTSLDLPVPQWEAALAQRPQGQAGRHPEGISDRRRARPRSTRSGSRASSG